MLTKIFAKIKNDDEIENPDFLPNPKYKAYADENGEIPIFVMEKKYLITDWGNKLGCLFVGLLFFLAIRDESDKTTFANILVITFIIFIIFGIIVSFLHDIFVRKIICYDKYFKVINGFKEYKTKYSQMPIMRSMRLGLPIFGYKSLTIWVNGNYFARFLNTEQFGVKNIWHFEKLLKHKGVREWSLFGYVD